MLPPRPTATVKKQEVYATIDQRLLGDDQFVDRVVEEHGRPVKKELRKREHPLARIAGAVAQAGGIALDDLRGSGRQRVISQGRVALTVIAKEYSYRGIEIADYLMKDPTAVTRYARKGDDVLSYVKTAEKMLAATEK